MDIDLIKPDTVVKAGPFKADALDMLLPRPLKALLEGHLRAPIYQRSGQDGAVQEVYPLRLRPGADVGIDLGKLGALWVGLGEGTKLKVEAPAWMEATLRQAAAGRLVGCGYTPRGLVHLSLELAPGEGVRVPLKGVGYLGLEAPRA